MVCINVENVGDVVGEVAVDSTISEIIKKRLGTTWVVRHYECCVLAMVSVVRKEWTCNTKSRG